MAEVQENIAKFDELGIKVIAGSVDNETEVGTIAAALNLTFPLVYGVQTSMIETLDAMTGVRQEKTYMQATEFILNPAGEVMASMYSSTQLGRMRPSEVLQFVKSRMG